MKNRKGKTDDKENNILSSGIIVKASGDDIGIFRYSSPAMRKEILKNSASVRFKEFSEDENEKAEEYFKRVSEEARARMYPLGYIAVRSGQCAGVYPYISADERLKLMNRYHRYEIKDFGHYLLENNALEWTGKTIIIRPSDRFGEVSVLLNRSLGISVRKKTGMRASTEHERDSVMKFVSGEHKRPHAGCHEAFEKIYGLGCSAEYHGIISSVSERNIFFSELVCTSGDMVLNEKNVWLYNSSGIISGGEGDNTAFYAEVFEYITDGGYTDYGLCDYRPCF